jgi:APA family basic amino acid/polyamine antiporter
VDEALAGEISPMLQRRLGMSAAIAMIVAEVMGVGIFLTPAGMARTLGDTGWVIGVWAIMVLLSIAGALCYAELGSRFPEAGGGYVFLREAFGERLAFIYGWMALLVMDPGLTAALGVGMATYLIAVIGAPPAYIPIAAIVAIVALGAVSILGIRASSRLMRWTAVAKLAAIALLIVAALVSSADVPVAGPVASADFVPSVGGLAGAFMGAFFAFGGWWDLGKMNEEIVDPRRTLPVALVGGLLVVAVVYTGLSLAFIHAVKGRDLATDEAFVTALGTSLFGAASGKILGTVVVVAVASSLAAILLGAPRVYLAMARSGVFPTALVRFHPTKQSAARATLVQVLLACVLVTFGTFEQIVGYFIPVVIFFLGLSACAMFVLPRPAPGANVFRAPLHPLPVIAFLVLVVLMTTLFSLGRPLQTFIGFAVVALGAPVAWFVLPSAKSRQPRADTQTEHG